VKGFARKAVRRSRTLQESCRVRNRAVEAPQPFVDAQKSAARSGPSSPAGPDGQQARHFDSWRDA